MNEDVIRGAAGIRIVRVDLQQRAMVTIGVSDLERSKAFYDKALKAIGIERLYSEGAEFFGYGAHKKAFFWIGARFLRGYVESEKLRTKVA